MMCIVRGIRLAGLLFAGVLTTLTPAAAQDFPSKPIRMIVGLAAGGGTDISARMIGQKMSESLKTTVLVENKPGGNFVIAGKELQSATPDGHTLFFI